MVVFHFSACLSGDKALLISLQTAGSIYMSGESARFCKYYYIEEGIELGRVISVCHCQWVCFEKGIENLMG